jgi:hypothetical protein
MSFDSGVNGYAISFVLAISLYPLAILIGSVLAWISEIRRGSLPLLLICYH